MADAPLSNYTRDLLLRLAAMQHNDPDAVEFSIHQTIKQAQADERERIAKAIESMDDGPITTRAVKAYLAAEVRRSVGG